MEREQAARVVADVERLDARARAAVRGFWEPAATWSVAALGSVVPASIGYGFERAVRWYWAVAVPVAVIVSFVLDRRRRVRPYVEPPPWWTLGVAAALVLFTPASILIVVGSEIGFPFPVVALASLVVGWLVASRPLVIASLLLLALSMCSPFFSSHAFIVLASSFTAAYVAATLFARRHAVS